MMMKSPSKRKRTTAGEKLRTLLSPGNLAKTVGSQIPVVSAGVEMWNQLEGFELKQRLGAVESEVDALAKLRTLERAGPTQPPLIHDWSIPVSEYLRRTVDIAVVYDGGFHSRAQRGRELIQSVAHACIIGDHEVLACKEALNLAFHVAEHKHGRAIIIAGFALYEFVSEPADESSGLCCCRLTERDAEKWRESAESWRKRGLGELVHELISTRVRYTLTPWMGQEIGFIHTGEAEDVLRGRTSLTKQQFDTSVVSHFRRPRDDGLKTFVTGVLAGRVLQAGSPVFSRDGTLLGILAGTESYRSDDGRRGVVRSLLGHPRFMESLKKQANSAEK